MALTRLAADWLAERVAAAAPDAVVDADGDTLWVAPPSIAQVGRVLQQDAALDFQFLNSISAIDYIGHFELVYHLTSFRRRHQAVLRSRLPGREGLAAPSVYHLWRGADFQEREIWDLMGIRFEGHPNMKRIMLWEGFDGHPLRKDYL